MSKDTLLFRLAQFVNYAFYVAGTLLLFRFVLKLLEANSAALFTQIVYGLTAPLVAPFQFVFNSDVMNGSVIEWNTLLALFVYGVLTEVIVRGIASLRNVRKNEARYALRSDA